MNMDLLMSRWGAVTGTIGTVAGTIALGIQIRHWRLDRAKLNVEAKISLVRTARSTRFVPVFSVHAVNVGRRPVRIKELVAELVAELPPQVVVPPGAAEKLPKLISNKLFLYDSLGADPIELSPDGGEHTWEFEVPAGVRFLCKPKGGEEYGKGHVMLTSGKKKFFEFQNLRDDQWPPPVS
jgi:hypothetical protein